MRRIGIFIAAGLLLGGAHFGFPDDLSSAESEGLRYPTGDHWASSSRNEKLAYLTGIGNAINVEFAYQMTSHPPPADAQTLVQRAHQGFTAHTVADVANRIDRWYAQHPDQRGKTIVDVIWLDVISPADPENRKR